MPLILCACDFYALLGAYIARMVAPRPPSDRTSIGKVAFVPVLRSPSWRRARKQLELVFAVASRDSRSANASD